MSCLDNLTYTQQTAIRGEISYALLTASHDAEIKFRIYLILKQLKSEFKAIALETIKEAVNFPEEEVYAIYLEALSGNFPTHLWVTEVIEDIKLNLQGSYSNGAYAPPTSLSINRLSEKKKIIESAFILFTRKIVMKSAFLAKELVVAVMDDPSLDFLSNACFYLMSCCEEFASLQQTQQEPPEELLNHFFNAKEVLSFQIETEALSVLDHEQVSNPKSILDTDLNQKSLSCKETEEIDKKILEIFNSSISKNPKQQPHKYIVQKVFKNSKLCLSLAVCNTRKQAEEFIENVKKEYPELLDTWYFEIKKIN
jgi:hypothetical protein